MENQYVTKRSFFYIYNESYQTTTNLIGLVNIQQKIKNVIV